MIRVAKILSAVALVGLTFSATQLRSQAHPSIDVAASNWKFTPNTITLHVGETTQLRLTSTEGVHGIKSDDLGIPLTTIAPGKFITVSVTPRKAGTYVVHCAIVCGPGHENMYLTIKVQ